MVEFRGTNMKMSRQRCGSSGSARTLRIAHAAYNLELRFMVAVMAKLLFPVKEAIVDDSPPRFQ